MLERDLERIATQLTHGILATLRAASLDDLAHVLPQVRKLVEQRARPVAVARPRSEAKANPAARPAPRKPAPRDGALGEQILRVLVKAAVGMRSEQLQSALHVDTLPLRATLNELLASGRIKREGQARGTRYMAGDKAERPERPERMDRPPAVPEIAVDMNVVNDIRAHLAGSTVPLSLLEIEELAGLSRPLTRAALEKLVTLGLASRHGHGPGVRYHLATRAQASAGEAPRVVRRPPRAKTWTATSAEPTPAAISAAAPTA